MIEKLLDFFFPKRCLGCGKVGSFICEVCEEKVPFLEIQYCAVCQKPSVSGFTHHRCRGNLKPDRLLCLFSYKGLGQTLVKTLKYGQVLDLSQVLTKYLVNFLDENNVSLGEGSIITYVPIHPIKLLERGFNQVAVLSRDLSKKTGLPTFELLKKVRETTSQTYLKKEERKKNVEGSFEMNEKYQSLADGQDVILLDDVYTTGATLLECSKVLKRAGARYIYLLTLAKD